MASLCVEPLPLLCMLIHPPAIQPSPNKPKTMPLPWTQISQTIVLCVLECKCMNPVAAVCTTTSKYVWSSMQKCVVEVWCMGIRAEFWQTILRVAGLLGPEQCWLPPAQKCEWFTRDGPQLFVAITLICTGVPTKPTLSTSYFYPPFFAPLCFLLCCYDLLPWCF